MCYQTFIKMANKERSYLLYSKESPKTSLRDLGNSMLEWADLSKVMLKRCQRSPMCPKEGVFCGDSKSSSDH